MLNTVVFPKDVLVLIPTCDANKQKMAAIKNSWYTDLKNYGYQCYFLKAQQGITETQINDSTITVPCSDFYEGLILKLLLSFKFVDNLLDFKYIYKIDDDCYLNVELLTKEILPQITNMLFMGFNIINTIGYTEHYGKCHNTIYEKPYVSSTSLKSYPHGGCSYFIARSLISKITYYIPEFSSEFAQGKFLPEDVRISEVLVQNSVLAQQLNVSSILKDEENINISSVPKPLLIWDIADSDRIKSWSNR
jgi:hypothetical protein